jgi:hypothetical protein
MQNVLTHLLRCLFVVGWLLVVGCSRRGEKEKEQEQEQEQEYTGVSVGIMYDPGTDGYYYRYVA